LRPAPLVQILRERYACGCSASTVSPSLSRSSETKKPR
jgi:hypothetical protein